MRKHRQKLLPPPLLTSLFAALAMGMLLAGDGSADTPPVKTPPTVAGKPRLESPDDGKTKSNASGVKERFRIRVERVGPFRRTVIIEDVVAVNQPFELRAKDGASATGALRRTADGKLHFKGEVGLTGTSALLDTPVELATGVFGVSKEEIGRGMIGELFLVCFTLGDVGETVRGVVSKKDELIVVPGPRLETQPPSQWFSSALKAENHLTADKETWLLFRSMQVNDKDRMHIERIEREGNAFVVTMNRAIWQGDYYRNVMFHEVHGVALGKLPAGKYTVRWILRETSFMEFDKDGRPKAMEDPARPVELKASFIVRAP
jgi:hypothetical protein